MSNVNLPKDPHDNASEQLIPLLWIRRGIGLLGIFFPFVLALGNYYLFDCQIILPTISDYFRTKMITIFVAMLSMISIFLWTYRGPEGEDKVWATLASVFCVGVALFPNNVKEVVKQCNGFSTYELDNLHHICAVGMFLITAYFCLFLFVKTKPENNPTEELKRLKRNRNIVYKICGYTIIVTIVLMFIYLRLDTKDTYTTGFPYIFWGETICLLAFGISWITKSNWFIFGDKQAK
ncbi:MAG: hypothetical protein IPN97_06890 [Saprospiraceae bacterium]|nr:hypothetical protein [Saprospiraceae bacterium]